MNWEPIKRPRLQRSWLREVRLIASILGGAVGLALVHLVLPGDSGGELSGRAVIVDGDTLRLGGERIRLKGMDAPELAQSCTGADGRSWPCGQQAKAALGAGDRRQIL